MEHVTGNMAASRDFAAGSTSSVTFCFHGYTHITFPFSLFGNLILTTDLCAILRFKFEFQDQRRNIIFFSKWNYFPFLYFLVVSREGVLSILNNQSSLFVKNGKICPRWYFVFSLSPQTEVVKSVLNNGPKFYFL